MTSSPTSSLWVMAFKILNLELAYWGCHQVMPEFGLLIQFRMSQNPMKEIKHKSRIQYIALAVVPRLSQVWLFLTPWTSAHQASLSFTISVSLLKLMSIELVMPSNRLTLCCPLLFIFLKQKLSDIFFNCIFNQRQNSPTSATRF